MSLQQQKEANKQKERINTQIQTDCGRPKNIQKERMTTAKQRQFEKSKNSAYLERRKEK